ncbi:MAG: methyltransferase [Pseudomonadota bacterium]
MSNPAESALDLLTGRWRSQILHAGVQLGVVDLLAGGPRSADQVAAELSLNPSNTYRLMRGLASIGILQEDAKQAFQLTQTGDFFRKDHPNTMRGVCLWEEGATLYRAWRHLPDIVREGGDDGIKKEFGEPVFELISSDPDVGAIFNDAMTSYSARETEQVLIALADYDVTNLNHVCDIGGGQGHLLCHLLQQHPHLSGTVFELPATLETPQLLLAESLGVGDRCDYRAGNMFEAVPTADAYLLKHILHDWNDDECVEILKNALHASSTGSRVLIAEYVVPGPETADFSKLFDVHMMSVSTGRERTEAEFVALLEQSGWKHTQTWRQPQGSMAVVEGTKSK